MSDPYRPDGLDAVPIKAGEAAAALDGLREPAERAASAIQDAFGRAGDSLAGSLVRAASDGKITLAELARSVLQAFSAGVGGSRGVSSGLTGGGLSGGLGEAIASAVGGLFGGTHFGGARADGGAVSAGGGYLVGERGPEVFRPGVGGTIETPGGGAGVTLNLTLQGGPEALIKSEAQIAQMLARAAALGARRL